MNNNLKQLYISGILGDGHLKASGAIMFSCIHGDNGYGGISKSTMIIEDLVDYNLTITDEF